MIQIIKNHKYLLMLWAFLLAAIFATFAHQGSVLIDCGREAYYPWQILAGKVLYKDLFNIYGPFSYLYNALLFKLFGVNLNVLYVSGCISAFVIVTTLYLMSKKFLSEALSFSISFFTIVIGVYRVWLFNYIFPYSYGMLYGFCAFLLSIFFLILYIPDKTKKKYLYLSMFFSGVCMANKYEFLPVFVVITLVPILLKTKKREIFISIVMSMLVPLTCLMTLFLQGLRISDLLSSFDVLIKMSETQTLAYFYKGQGIYPTTKSITYTLISFVRTFIPFLLFIGSFKIKNKVLSVAAVIISTIFICLSVSPSSFTFLPLLVLIVAFLRIKALKENVVLLLLLFSGLFYSLKVYWGITTQTYGVFFLPFLVLILFALLFSDEKLKLKYQKNTALYLILLSLIFAYHSKNDISNKKIAVETKMGRIFESKSIAVPTNDLISYLRSNSNSQDTAVIMPEGMLINFLSEYKTDDYYNSYIPLYVETFGETKLIEQLKHAKPKYIIFNNWDNKDYYFHYICEDYAFGVCKFVVENYKLEKTFGSEFKYVVYKIKK